MKTFYFNIQSKGGVGKSMLTYLQALKYEADESVMFVDLDSSTQSSLAQLEFISKKGRLIRTDIYDRNRKLDRERFVEVIEALNRQPASHFYIDFGAPESEQLLGLLTLDFTIDEFKEIERELKAKIVFNIIVAGGPAYETCMLYLKKITGITKGHFDISVYLNQFTFYNYDQLVTEAREFAKSTKGLIKQVYQYGEFHPDRRSGQIILNNIRSGSGLVDYHALGVKLILRRELKKI
ncbi:hypothetical protein [Niabella hirudinis]|uniref:hypothetical protein n=1 Tax=Niabella hirudinis TaxID=1285929 RepID=UPI003EB8E050